MREHNHIPVAIIGYSGHAYVAIDILQSTGIAVAGYCELQKKDFDPFSIPYLGCDEEDDTIRKLRDLRYFVAIGENQVRRSVMERLMNKLPPPVNAIHRAAIVADSAIIGSGVMIAAAAVINPLAVIGLGVVCNTSCSIDHECRIADFAHIAPGAVLSGNVTVGENTFVGAGAVVKQGVRIGKNVVVGAGSVIIRDIPDGQTIIGNPGYELKNI
ncbi:MAG: acetyltransferase [Chitinophagaceae bacterium]